MYEECIKIHERRHIGCPTTLHAFKEIAQHKHIKKKNQLVNVKNKTQICSKTQNKNISNKELCQKI